ncbi:MAG TPA: cytochrome P450 [Thermoanaerobaculia bacterium]|nr:cytochrome P450 [Thermoanaerobaculia bacterium]
MPAEPFPAAAVGSLSAFPLPQGSDPGISIGRIQALLQATAELGDVFRATPAGQEPASYIVSHPDHVKQVLQDRHENYRQNFRQKPLMGRLSLTLASGEEWRLRRRLLQPMFVRERLAPLVPAMTEGAGRLLERWDRAAAAGSALDVAKEMIDLSLSVLIEALLGSEPGGNRSLHQAILTAFEWFNRRLRRAKPTPVYLPTHENVSLLLALRRLKTEVKKTVAARRASGREATDFLSLMIAARDERNSSELSDEQILDELMMMLVMGHVPTAMALTWTWHLLDRHPEVDERMRAEHASALGDRVPEFADAARLPYTRQILEESMRLFPPSWSFARVAVADDALGGKRIPAGSLVIVCPWLTHRRPELWDDPERFDPERFTPERAAARPRFAYYPFGGGPRVCIARELALLEMPLILATIARRYRLRPIPGRSVAPVAGIALRPSGGLRSRLEPLTSPASHTAPLRAAGPPDLSPDSRPDSYPTTLGALFAQTVAADRPAVLLEKSANGWTPVSARELGERVRLAASALLALGIAPGERVALVAWGGPAWSALDLACAALGAVVVPLPDDLPPSQLAARLATAQARVAFVEGDTAAALDELAENGALPTLSLIVRLPAAADAAVPAEEASVTRRTMSFRAFLTSGAPGLSLDEVVRRAGQRSPEEIATLAFTAGSHGDARPIELSHGQIAAAARALSRAGLPLGAGDVGLCTRSLAHPSERAFHYWCLSVGATIAHATSAASAIDDLATVEPHAFTSDPGLWKILLNWLFDRVQQQSEWRQKLFRRIVFISRQSLPFREEHRRPPGFQGWQLKQFERFVFAPFRARLGKRFRFALSGGAKMSNGWITFLWAMGLPVYEGWSLTESAGVATLNTPVSIRAGSAGVPLPGIELRLAPDGELLVRGANVVPSASPDGYFATGDAGFFDDADMLQLFGPKDERTPDASGHAISPAPLESMLRGSHSLAQALVVVRDVPVALLVPDLAALDAAAQGMGFANRDPESLIAQPKIRAIIAADLQGINARLPQAERIRRWELTLERFTVAAGEITWTGSFRRAEVHARRAAEIDKLFPKEE